MVKWKAMTKWEGDLGPESDFTAKIGRKLATGMGLAPASLRPRMPIGQNTGTFAESPGFR